MLYKHYSIIIEISLKRHIYMYVCVSIYILIIYLYTIIYLFRSIWMFILAATHSDLSCSGGLSWFSPDYTKRSKNWLCFSALQIKVDR